MVCALILVLGTGLGALIIEAILAAAERHPATDAYSLSDAALRFAGAAALAPTLRCRGDRAMQPRPALRRLWIVVRLSLLGNGVLAALLSIALFVQGGYHAAYMATAGSSAAHLLVAALATPRNRGRIHRRLGRLGGRGTEAEEAAAVATLVGGSDSDSALERAAELLRCLPASQLHAADLADELTASPDAGPTLHARTEPAAMGQVTAFLSHSWRDEDDPMRPAPSTRLCRAGQSGARRRPASSRRSGWCAARPHSPHPSPAHICTRTHTSREPRIVPRRTRRASTRSTSSSRSPACPSSSRAARRCSSWPGPRTAHGCGASWSSSRSLGVSACCAHT